MNKKFLLENHSVNLSKLKELQELRSGPYSVVKKTINVNYETELDHDKKVRKKLGEDELDYEVHLAAKMGYIIYHNYLKIKESWHNAVMNQCELD